MIFFRRFELIALAVYEGKGVIIPHRFSIIISLNPTAADPFQEGDLFLRLHTFRQCPYPQHPCHCYNRSDDLPASVIEVTEKTHVDFYDIEIIVVKRIQ